MTLAQCPHMSSYRCPHKVDACDDTKSKTCHYVINTVGIAATTIASIDDAALRRVPALGLVRAHALAIIEEYAMRNDRRLRE